MIGITRIIDKIKAFPISESTFSVDTHGLGCILKITGGDAEVFISDAAEAFPVKDGETLEFCGNLLIKASTDSATAHCLYYKTL